MNTIIDDLQAEGSGLGAIASTNGATTSGAAQPRNVGRPPPGPSRWGDDIPSTGDTGGGASMRTASAQDGADGISQNDSFRTQFAMAAYSATTLSNLGSPVTASAGGIDV